MAIFCEFSLTKNNVVEQWIVSGLKFEDNELCLNFAGRIGWDLWPRHITLIEKTHDDETKQDVVTIHGTDLRDGTFVMTLKFDLPYRFSKFCKDMDEFMQSDEKRTAD